MKNIKIKERVISGVTLIYSPTLKQRHLVKTFTAFVTVRIKSHLNCFFFFYSFTWVPGTNICLWPEDFDNISASFLLLTSA
jgi:hypothetical protein